MAQNQAAGKVCPLPDGHPVTTEFSEREKEDHHILDAHTTQLNTVTHHEGGNPRTLYFVGNPTVAIDKFAFTAPVPTEDQGGIKSLIMALKDSMHCKKVRSTTYALGFAFGLQEESAIVVQAAPYSKDMNYLRIEFNPVKLGDTCTNTLVGQILPVLFPHGIPTPRITRVHVAIDFRGTQVSNLLLYAPGFRKHQTIFSASGGGGSQYEGSHTSNLQIVLYDKQEQAKLPYPCTRVEFRYEPRPGVSFNTVQNLDLFSKACLYKVQALGDIKSHELAGFLAYVREFGFSGAKKLWPKLLFKNLLSQLQTFQLWRPDAMHTAYLGRLEELQALLPLKCS